MKYDYLIYKDSIKGIKVFDKEKSLDALRKGNHSLKIKKSSFDIIDNQFTKSLFLDHLYQSENYLIKYIFLYQILEHFIEESADKLLDELIQTYQDKKITKNTLRERLGRIASDRSLLKKVFEKSIINKEIKSSFVEKCTFLFNDIGEDVEETFEDVLYDLRNLITHRYRAISNKTEDLKKIVSLFESLIIELLISLNSKEKKELETEDLSLKIQPQKRGSDMILHQLEEIFL